MTDTRNLDYICGEKWSGIIPAGYQVKELCDVYHAILEHNAYAEIDFNDGGLADLDWNGTTNDIGGMRQAYLLGKRLQGYEGVDSHPGYADTGIPLTLGFDDDLDDMQAYFHLHPEIWGNEHGYFMLDDSSAYGIGGSPNLAILCRGNKRHVQLVEITDHWEGVVERLRLNERERRMLSKK